MPPAKKAAKKVSKKRSAKKSKSKAVVARSGGTAETDPLEYEKLCAQALEWHIQKMSYRWIAQQQGISVKGAYDRVAAGLARMYPVDEVDAYRAQQRAEWEVMRKILWKDILDEETPRSARLECMDRLLKIQQAEAKLLGLNMPERVQVDGKIDIAATVQGDLDKLVAEIEEYHGEIVDAEVVEEGKPTS